jgi:hypothetical protein
MFFDVKYLVVFMFVLPELAIFTHFLLDFYRGAYVEGHMDAVRGHKMAA